MNTLRTFLKSEYYQETCVELVTICTTLYLGTVIYANGMYIYRKCTQDNDISLLTILCDCLTIDSQLIYGWPLMLMSGILNKKIVVTFEDN